MTNLDEVIHALESVSWRDIEGVTSAEAAMFTQRLANAEENGNKEVTDHVP